MTTKQRKRAAPTVPTVSDTTARVTRGGAQGGLAYALTVLLGSFVTLTAEQFGAIVVVAGLVISFAQNVLENRGVIPALLKSVPPKDEPVPVVDDAGYSTPGGLLAALIVVCVLVVFFTGAVHSPLILLVLLVALLLLFL